MKQLLTAIHQNENGADEGINKLAILALIAIPLILVLIYFGQTIKDAATTAFDNMMGNGVN